jgi:hypothetical protein
MNVIPKEKADWVKAFRRCGLSETLTEFALGEPAEPLFESDCQRDLLAQPFEHLPEVPGPPITPLWHVTTAVVGCRKKGKGLEFVEVQMEEVFRGGPEPVKVIASSEQGLWAWLFRSQLEVALTGVNQKSAKRKAAKLEQLREAANGVGFLHFEEALERVKGRGGYDEFVLALK